MRYNDLHYLKGKKFKIALVFFNQEKNERINLNVSSSNGRSVASGNENREKRASSTEPSTGEVEHYSNS